jgi:myo-inositol-1-phosphate synthase
MKQPQEIKKADGKLGVLLPGMGAVATTFVAGCLLARKGIAQPVGSLTQMGTVRLGKRTDNRSPLIKDFVPLAGLDDLVFGGWDIFPDNAYESAAHAAVLEQKHLDPIRGELEAIRPMPGVFYPEYVKRLHGTHVKTGTSKADMVEKVREDIRTFMKNSGCSRAVTVWCGSTEIYIEQTAVHQSMAAFEKGLLDNDPSISNSQIYAWACLKEGVPFANGAPNLTVDFPAAHELARERGRGHRRQGLQDRPDADEDHPRAGLQGAACSASTGWYSTNILGNRDGEVLDDPESFKTKEVSKLGVLEHILQPDTSTPTSTATTHHVVRINYYPPRGDNKEGWDNIDIFGWLGYPMQIKIDFLCRDSILAAPIVLDLALFLDLAQRAGMSGVQEWLSFYFKSPMTAPGPLPRARPVHPAHEAEEHPALDDGRDLITHLGHEYYD